MSHGNGSEVVAPRSKFYQGPFGRLFGGLDPWKPPGLKTEEEIIAHFLTMANKEMVEVSSDKTPSEIAHDPKLIDELESKFGSATPAGYTYFGQFVDHDITFDPASSLMRSNDPGGLLNHRTPRLDLDNVYGRGPADSPYLYDNEDREKNPEREFEKFLIGKIPGSTLKDLPRNAQDRALIGDMRNDENAMVSQLQLAFLLAHNELVDRARVQKSPTPFDDARCTLRWLYQYVVWNDLLKRITIEDVRTKALVKSKTPDNRSVWKLGFEDVYKWRNAPFMPVEFSVAAYRFGHSMVRNAYRTNFPHSGAGPDDFIPIFDNDGTEASIDLRGFRQMTAMNSIQWDCFLPMETSQGEFPQKARQIDTKLSNALLNLHEKPKGSNENILAFRNLVRSWRFGLPSGTAVAEKLGVKPIAIESKHDALWFYILKEAEVLPGAKSGQTLGRVGSIIVCATFAGLLQGDPNSWYNVKPDWTPDKEPLLKTSDKKDADDWTLASIIRLSGLPVSAKDF